MLLTASDQNSEKEAANTAKDNVAKAVEKISTKPAMSAEKKAAVDDAKKLPKHLVVL